MIPAIKSPALRLLLEHYLEVRGDRRMPSRRDLDAAKLGPVLPIIWVNEYEPAAGTFRYRLAGEEVNEIFGVSVAGKLLSDFVGPDRFGPVNDNFLRVIREDAVLLATGPIYSCTDRIALGERLALPLSSDGEKADGLLGATARETMVDLKSASMTEQTVTFIPLDEIAQAMRRAVGD
jgi:hypothetical protein